MRFISVLVTDIDLLGLTLNYTLIFWCKCTELKT